MGLFGKKYKTDASGDKVRIADKGYEKEYLKKTKKYIYNRTGSESKAATLKEAREEAAAAKKMPITEGYNTKKPYSQDTRVEVPRSFKEKRNIFGGKAGKAKNKKIKGDTKIVRVKNEKQAAKAHKRRAEAGLTKEFSIPKGKAENYPMSEEDKNYILTGEGRPSSKDIKAKILAKKDPEEKDPEKVVKKTNRSKHGNLMGGKGLTPKEKAAIKKAKEKKKKEKEEAEKAKRARLKSLLPDKDKDRIY